MHFGIRFQLLSPLVPLVLGLAATTAWTAHSAASAARQEILAELANIVDTLRDAPFPHEQHILKLIKGLSGADLVLVDRARDQTLTTFADSPLDLTDDLGKNEPQQIRIGDTEYLCRSASLPYGRVLAFLPTSVLDDAVARAVRPALFIGGIGGVVSILLALWLTQRLTGRIHDLQRRTREIAGGDFSPMPIPPHGDELVDLGHSINDMAQQLARFQETLKSTERLRLLGQVSGGLAHQMRNSIAGAKLALQLFSREHGGSPESLSVALRQLALMENYIKRFFDLGKALELRRAAVDVAVLADETAALLRPQCEHANIELALAPRVGPAIISADADQLRQVLFNLINNAIEAAGPGGHVKVRTEANDSGVAVEVADTGSGIPSDVAARLFEPFVTGKPEGVGLGLAVAKQIADAHGGRLTWLRESGATIFRLELPGRLSA